MKLNIRELVESKLFESASEVKHLSQEEAFKNGYDVPESGCYFVQVDLGFMTLDLLSFNGNEDYTAGTEVNGFSNELDNLGEDFIFDSDIVYRDNKLYDLAKSIEDNCKSMSEVESFLRDKGFSKLGD